jgi:hydroxyacylglutathione hydrolase
MIFETIKTEGLAHFSYIIGDEEAGVCAVIDPRRDVDVYLELARQHQVQIAYILETHLHADFVSGSCELAAQTGAPICVGAAGNYSFECKSLGEDEILELGSLQLKVIHTPGHTPEHICYLISGGSGAEAPWGLFSGDALFAGEVGRPDLVEESTPETLADQLYKSLFQKILPLGDELVIYPAHGQGSPCGSQIGDRPLSTIGYERRHNPRLQVENQAEFVAQLLDAVPPPPTYYDHVKRVNTTGPSVLGGLPYLAPLSPEQFQREMGKLKTTVVDTREIEAFGGAHLAGSLNIALRDAFPLWAGWLLPSDERLLLVMADEGDLETLQRHLLRVDFTNVAGYLRRGVRGWIEEGLPFSRILQLSVHELQARISDEQHELQVLDVRDDEEWVEGHIPTAQHQPLPFLQDHLDELDPHRSIATYCGSGYRSSMAASLLQRHGFSQVYNIPGSMTAWKAAKFPLIKT